MTRTGDSITPRSPRSPSRSSPARSACCSPGCKPRSPKRPGRPDPVDEHTFQTPDVSPQEPAGAPASPNGNHPLGYGELLAQVAGDAKLAARAIEDLDMRVQAV